MMQLSVDKEGKVIEIAPLNKEAEIMIQSLNIEAFFAWGLVLIVSYLAQYFR